MYGHVVPVPLKTQATPRDDWQLIILRVNAAFLCVRSQESIRHCASMRVSAEALWLGDNRSYLASEIVRAETGHQLTFVCCALNCSYICCFLALRLADLTVAAFAEESAPV